MSSIVLKGAEVEQSHMPWSRGANADHARAIRMAESLADRQGVSPDAVYNAACAFSLASLDAAVSDAERSRRADRAMTYLSASPRRATSSPGPRVYLASSPARTR